MASSLRLMIRPSTFTKISFPSPILSRQFTTVRPLFFHNTTPVKILPAGPRISPLQIVLTASPEVIEGTVNDPVPMPAPHKSHGSYHWTFERALSVALIPLVVTPFVTGSSTPVLDALIGTSVVIHSHIGFDSIIIDYIPKRKYPKAHAAFSWALRGATVAVLIGIYEFQVNEVGIVEGVKRVWKA